MGIDVLDITFRIEKSFKIDLPAKDLTNLARHHDIAVGDLYDLVLKKMGLRDVARHDIRLNYFLWVDIQRTLHAVTGVPLDRIELKTPLETLFPRQTRRQEWDALRRTCPYRVRELDYPKVVRNVACMLTAGVSLIELFEIWQVPGANWLWPLLALFGIWVFIETYLKILSICAPLRNCFPSRMATVKDLCRAIFGSNYADLCKNVEMSLDQRCVVVWEQLTKILVDALGVDADEVTFRSRLFRDLGMS